MTTFCPFLANSCVLVVKEYLPTLEMQLEDSPRNKHSDGLGSKKDQPAANRKTGLSGVTQVNVDSSTHLPLQESLKNLHDAENDMRVLHERVRYVHIASRLLILDGYRRGEFSFLVYVEALPEKDLVGGALEVASTAAVMDFSRFVLHFNSVDIPVCQDGEKQPMFVSIVETVNDPNTVIRSLARLDLSSINRNRLGQETSTAVFFSHLQPLQWSSAQET